MEQYGTAGQATGDSVTTAHATMATDTHSEFLTLVVFPRQQ